jgi:hypothetical protein
VEIGVCAVEVKAGAVAQALMFGVGEDAMNLSQDQIGKRRAGNLNIVPDTVEFGLPQPSVPKPCDTADHPSGDETTQVVGGRGRTTCEHQRPGVGSTTSAKNFGASDCRFVGMVAPWPANRPVDLGVGGGAWLIRFRQPTKAVAFERHYCRVGSSPNPPYRPEGPATTSFGHPVGRKGVLADDYRSRRLKVPERYRAICRWTRDVNGRD